MRICLFIVFAASCGSGEVPPESRLYVRQLQPLLSENSLLAERVLQGSAAIHNGESTPEAAAVSWEREIVPLATHLHDQALRLDAPGSWAAPHQRLAATWGERAEAYEVLTQAIGRGDRALWRKGRALADQAKLDEEAWFDDANARLAPAGIPLDQYP